MKSERRFPALLHRLPQNIPFNRAPFLPPTPSSLPHPGTNCETFWETDPLTDSCYQFNFQATLSWIEAWISCQQQGADLLSITKLHEQTYITGTDALPPVRSLPTTSCPV